jgi:hypothetical protein
MIEEIEGQSLPIRDEQRRYRIHDLYVDLLRHAAAPLAARHVYLAARYRSACPSGWDAARMTATSFAICPGTCVRTQQAAELRDLLLGFPWLRHKLA